MNVLSLFDGMSCGQIALERANIPVDIYYAAEIDKYAVQVSKANYPNTIHLGDVTKWREWDIDFSSIDLLIGGSPCQGFSVAGEQGGTKCIFNDEEIVVTDRKKYLEMKGKGAEFLSQSFLFWEFVLLLDHVKSLNPSVQFMLENVKMAKNNMDMITTALGVEPVFINSALVSAQNRQRWYWANWNIPQPEDKGILLKDIIEGDGFIKTHGEYKPKTDKAQCLDANYHKGVDNHGQRTIIRPCELKPFNKDSLCHHVANATDIKGNESIKRVYAESGKCPTLTTMGGGHREPKVLTGEQSYRKLTPLECERLQTVPDGYTDHVSNTQRYKMLGNGWTVDVIAHIFKHGLPTLEDLNNG